MALPNPIALADPLRFEPVGDCVHSRSPSRSPVRKAAFTAKVLDPLLGNLSPETTLQALSITDALSSTNAPPKNELSKIIDRATAPQRVFGIKAALAAQKVRQWCAELSSWQWPNAEESALGA